VSRNRTFDHKDPVLCEDADHFEVLNGYAAVPRLARHAHAFENARRSRCSTDRTRGTEAVVLTVCGLTDPAEAVDTVQELQQDGVPDAPTN